MSPATDKRPTAAAASHLPEHPVKNAMLGMRTAVIELSLRQPVQEVQNQE
jgi:hypothetical protein